MNDSRDATRAERDGALRMVARLIARDEHIEAMVRRAVDTEDLDELRR